MRIAREVIAAIALSLVTAGAAQAHFIWAAVAPNAAGKPAAQLWFSEGAAPGEPGLVSKITHSKAWRRDLNGSVTELSLSEEQSASGGALVSALENDAPCSIEVECIYGTFDRGAGAMMLEYYAKSLHGATKDELAKFGPAEKLAFDVTPTFDGDKVTLSLLWKGSAATDAEVTVIGPNDEDQKLKTDAAGKCEFNAKENGVYAVRAFLNEPETSGEHDGTAYKGVRRYSTLTFELAANNSSATPSTVELPADANDLLKHARDQRSLWDGFPGFTCGLTLQDGEHAVDGKLKVTADGEVELTGYGDMNLGWARGQLESMVQHRFSGNGPESEVEYVSETVQHPLGTLLRFKNDPEMKSAYRINGDIIAQVNRQMGKSRFSINVIEVHRNPEGKYLPSVFQVNFWDSDSNELKSSMSCYNSWTRVGDYDLPSVFSFVDAADNKNEVHKMIFHDVKLLTE